VRYASRAPPSSRSDRSISPAGACARRVIVGKLGPVAILFGGVSP